MEDAIWRDIIGYEGLYCINIHGRLLSCRKAKVLVNVKDSNGYYVVKLSKNGIPERLYVHRLIAIYFINNDDPVNKTDIHHKDDNPSNYHIDNLMWVTPLQNQMFAILSGRKKPSKHMLGRTGKSHPLSMPVLRVSNNGEEVQFECAAHAASKSNADQSAIHKACKGMLKQHKGFTWKYI